MKRVVLFCAAILAFHALHAQQHYQFRTDAEQGFHIENSNTSGLSLHYTLTGIDIANIDNGEAKGQEIVLKGQFVPRAEGLPNLPFESRYIALPRGATASIEIKENASTTLSGIDLLPSAPILKNADVGLPKLWKNKEVYGKDSDFPSENVTIAQATQIRGLDVVLLNVTPFRYNPVRKSLEVIYDMDIEVRFEGGNGQFGDVRYLNPDWDNILRDLVLNSDMLPQADYYGFLNDAIKTGQEGCEYLIIAPDDDNILTWAEMLRAFRTKQGILTKVVTTSECGNTPEQIKSYIQNAYSHWAIPPAAVMIFNGMNDTLIHSWPLPELYEEGTSGIPGFPLVFLNYNDQGENHNYRSDNPYSDMNGDSIPDLALSRLPALTEEEYRTQVLKLIQYETNPPTDPQYYDQPIITSGHENNKWFMITSQSLNGFFCNKLGRHPHNFYMIYESSYPPQVIPDSAWSTGYNTAAVVDFFGPDGQNYIPRYIGELDDWRSMMDHSYFINALNDGSFLTIYRDHSATDFWCCPDFDYYMVDSLTSPSPTFVLSIGCNTGKYTDTYYQGYISRPSILNTFCRNQTGALGGIGATTVTHSHYNDIFTWGVIDYIWPQFMPGLGSNTIPQFVRPSYAMVAGKLFLLETAFLSNWNKIVTTSNVFHYLGETYLNLCTEVPQQISANVPDLYNQGASPYCLTAEKGAIICLSKDDEIIEVATATGNEQSFVIPEMPIGEKFHVTITKQNRIRFDQDVTCMIPGEPYVFLQEAIVNNPSGSGHIQANAITSIDVVLHNGNDIASDASKVTLSSPSPYLEILKGTAKYPSIAPNGEVTLENAFQVGIHSDIPDQSEIVLKVHFHEGQNTHSDSFQAIADAPVITITPDLRISDVQGKPSTHLATEGKSTLTFLVSNQGHAESDLISAKLTVKAPFVETESGDIYFGTVQPGELKDISLELYSDGSDLQPAWLQAHLDLQHGQVLATKDTLLQYGGIYENFETDTLNPYFKWTNTGSHKWTYCDESPYEDARCLMSNADTVTQSRLKATLQEPYVGHPCKISFQFKTGTNDTLTYSNYNNGTHGIGFSSEEWQYAEVLYNGADKNFNWYYLLSHPDGGQAYLDDLCFPPLHRTIASAGDDLLHCGTEPLTLTSAYAYDCNYVYWTTEGDGAFDVFTNINPTYFIGQQDWENGSVILTLHAIGNTDTIVSSTQIRFAEETSIGDIVGDTLVFKDVTPVSRYLVDFQEGINYHWTLEPANAGSIYGQGNEIDVHWNLYASAPEAFLTVTPDNGCETSPVVLHISLTGTSVNDWKAPMFKIFPNPTDGLVNLVFGDFGEDSQGKAIVEVYNLVGEKMLAKNVQEKAATLDLSHFAPNLYIIKVSTPNGSWCEKVSLK